MVGRLGGYVGLRVGQRMGGGSCLGCCKWGLQVEAASDCSKCWRRSLLVHSLPTSFLGTCDRSLAQSANQ